MGGQFWNEIRESIVGNDLVIRTPFGRRRAIYADYTASGRGVGIIEDYMRHLLASYANTHTEDDETGRMSTERLHAAEATIKRLVGADDSYGVIMVGAGTTAAVQRLQQILGLYIPPSTRERLRLGEQGQDSTPRDQPVVFVGPYEHHSNELSWRESLAEVVEIDLDDAGLLDLKDLERKLLLPRYEGRLRMGAFSAAANVTGLITPVHDVARILHRQNALAFFDYAAAAPYRTMNVQQDEEAYFDALYFSPHKFLGGPGAAGVLVLRKELYRKDLPPTFAGGGTVDFVNWDIQDYTQDMETREKAGTPGITQTLRAALAMELKEKLGVQEIEQSERDYIKRAMDRFASIPEIDVVGNDDPAKRLAILSFVVRFEDGYLHPRFVTQLLNDLFGIQSRSGCLCAGPYGHRLLGIDRNRSGEFRHAIVEEHLGGLKPGWTRVNFHYLLTEEEFVYICDAIEFVGRCGVWFLSQYTFDLEEGGWSHNDTAPQPVRFGLEEAIATDLSIPTQTALSLGESMERAEQLGSELKNRFDKQALTTTDRRLVPFLYMNIKALRSGVE